MHAKTRATTETQRHGGNTEKKELNVNFFSVHSLCLRAFCGRICICVGFAPTFSSRILPTCSSRLWLRSVKSLVKSGGAILRHSPVIPGPATSCGHRAAPRLWVRSEFTNEAVNHRTPGRFGFAPHVL